MHSQRGSILVFVTLTVAILMIVGVTFATATTAEYRSAMHHTQGTQAFYIAEAGLNWARRGLQTGAIVLPAIGIGHTHVLYRSPAFGSPVGAQVLADVGEVEVAVRRLAAAQVELVVQGRQAQARRTLAVLANETQAAVVDTILSRHQSHGPVVLANNATVRGDISGTSFVIHSNAQIIDGVPIVAPTLTTFYLPEFSLPHGLTARAAVNVTSGTHTLAGSGIYPSIRVENAVLRIDVPDANDVIIQAGTLTLGNNTTVNRVGSGTGRVVFHVTGSATIENNTHINRHGFVERFVVYYHPGTRLVIENNASYTGVLVTRTAPVTISNNASLVGHLITGSASTVLVDNNAQIQGMIYAPAAPVQISNNAVAGGTVIAGSILVQNNGHLNLATQGFTSFEPFVSALDLWPAVVSYSFHTWGSR